MAQPGAVCWQELESIKLKLWAMEQAQGPEPPRAQALAEKEEGSGAMLAQQLLSPETGRSQQDSFLGRWVGPPSPQTCSPEPASSSVNPDGLQTAAGKGPLTGSAGLAGSSKSF